MKPQDEKIIIIQLLIVIIGFSSYFTFKYIFNSGETLSRKNNYKQTLIVEEKYKSKRLPNKFFRLIKDTSSATPKLVLRFSEINCGTCVTREIRQLRNFSNIIGWNRIIFIASNND